MKIPRLIAVTALPNYRIHLGYADGVEGDVELAHLTGKGVFNIWTDYKNFEKVRVSDAGAIAWSESVEICPDAMYMKLTGKSPEDLFPGLRRELIDA